MREIPGLSLMFVAALMMRVAQSRRAALALLLMGIGYVCFTFVHSYGALLVMVTIGSLGFHNWLPLQSSLGMGLVEREHSGRVLGRVSACNLYPIVAYIP